MTKVIYILSLLCADIHNDDHCPVAPSHVGEVYVSYDQCNYTAQQLQLQYGNEWTRFFCKVQKLIDHE